MSTIEKKPTDAAMAAEADGEETGATGNLSPGRVAGSPENIAFQTAAAHGSKTLFDVLRAATSEEVLCACVRHYPEHAGALACVFEQLRKMRPARLDAPWELEIECIVQFRPADSPYWSVSGREVATGQSSSWVLTPWNEWLALLVPSGVLERLTPADIIAHTLYEMTFFGFTEARIRQVREEWRWEDNAARADAGVDPRMDERNEHDP